jgi:ABC-type uncharacterized transport system ATPase subunit
MANENVIQMIDVTKRFGDFVANDKINLELRKGEIHALLGENGAGKSTLMNILSGLLEPTEGEVHVNGKLEISILHQKLLISELVWFTSILCLLMLLPLPKILF